MLKKFVLILIVVIAGVLLMNCGDMLNQQKAKERDLGHMVEENMKTSKIFMDNFVSFTIIETGKYKCVTKGLKDAQEIGKFAYNTMSVLMERNNTKVKTGVGTFTVYGEQDGKPIFEVYMTAGILPEVTLKGDYEGQTWTLNSQKTSK
jgi:hypothetical protein